jgi:flagellum-specific peptidoglycan hydrolase FlgJ
MTPSEFIATISPAAVASMLKTKVPASVTIAQAAKESGWGEDAPGHNLFGVKADSGWHGPTVMVSTHEFVRGKKIPIKAPFRAYPDWFGSIEDHAEFLVVNPRYVKAFMVAGNAEAFATALQAAGYATDPQYADGLINLIRGHKLTVFDKVSA